MPSEAANAIQALYDWAKEISVRQAVTEALLKKVPNLTEDDWSQAEEAAKLQITVGAHRLDSWDSLATHLRGLKGR